MKIVTVIPIAKGIPREELSYFSAREVALGTLVTVPFGKRSIKGVVIDSNEVRDLKSSIKTSNFALRNITTIHTDSLLPHALFVAAQKTAKFFAQPVGRILQTMIPQIIFDYYLEHAVNTPPQQRTRPDIVAMQAPRHERIAYYKTLAREHLAKQESMMIVVPHIAQAEKIFDALSSGIADHIFINHGKKTKKYLIKNIEQIISEKKPVIVVTTAPYAALVRTDWASIIIEQSSSPHYRYTFSPIFDMSFFIEQLALALYTKTIVADTLLSTQIRSRIISREIIDIRSTWHITHPERWVILDMKHDSLGQETKKKFSMLHKKTLSMIKEAISRKSNTLLVTTRKGFAPFTSCSDCGTIVACPECDTPLVLHRTSSREKNRMYLCHHCKYTAAPSDNCRSCGGTRLAMLGISTDGIKEELVDKFPKSTVFISDGDTTTTPVAVQKLVKQWQDKPGSIMIATYGILPYLDTVPFGAIISLDSLLSLPSYNSGERTLGTVLEFLEKMSDGAIIQTRTYTHPVIEALVAENIFDYMKQEQEDRTFFHYPPSTTLIKISHTTIAKETAAVTDYYEKVFRKYKPDILVQKAKKVGHVTVQAIMKIDPQIWNDLANPLHQTLSELSLEFVKEINPDSII